VTDLAFIEVTVSNQIVWHGYDQLHQEVVQHIDEQTPQRKIVAVSRIQSISEKYILVSSGFGRLVYWQYHDGYETLKRRLEMAGLLIDIEEEG
jgi:hypothetical protein